MRAVALVALAAGLAACGGAPPIVVAARDALRVSSDTSGDAAPPTTEDARRVAQLVHDYLRVRPAGLAPNPYWQRDEQDRFRHFDLAGAWTYGSRTFRQRFGSYRVEVSEPPASAEPGTLEATVTFAPRTPGRAPVIVRLFARREEGTWRLGGALPQLTRGWPTVRAGRLVFRLQPGMAFDSATAVAEARYLDSLAAVFDVRLPDEILYVRARSTQEALFALGVSGLPAPWGAFENRRNRLIVSGGGARDPHALHELAHAVFEEVDGWERRHRLATEGAAEWMQWRMLPSHEWSARHQLRAALALRPALGVRDVARQVARTDDDSTRAAEMAFYPTAGWLVGRVYRAAGVRGVRELLTARQRDPDEFLAVARRQLRMSPRELDDAWRQWTREAGNTVASP